MGVQYLSAAVFGAAACGGCGVLGWDDVLLDRCGPLTAPLQVQAPLKDANAAVHVYLLRGLADVYSLGLDELGEKLRAAGYSTSMVDYYTWPSTAERIISDSVSKGSTGDLVFVGHSYGADDAVHLAKSLQQRGLGVRLILLLDATRPPPIPANVDKCIHFYMPTFFGDQWPERFAGNPVFAEAGNERTLIENRYARAEPIGAASEACINHFNIDAVQPMQDVVLAEIMKLGETVPGDQFNP